MSSSSRELQHQSQISTQSSETTIQKRKLDDAIERVGRSTEKSTAAQDPFLHIYMIEQRNEIARREEDERRRHEERLRQEEREERLERQRRQEDEARDTRFMTMLHVLTGGKITKQNQ